MKRSRNTSDSLHRAFGSPALDDPPLTGTWSVYHATDGVLELVEGDLPEEIARQLVADHEAEGDRGYVAVNEA